MCNRVRTVMRWCNNIISSTQWSYVPTNWHYCWQITDLWWRSVGPIRWETKIRKLLVLWVSPLSEIFVKLKECDIWIKKCKQNTPQRDAHILYNSVKDSGEEKKGSGIETRVRRKRGEWRANKFSLRNARREYRGESPCISRTLYRFALVNTRANSTRERKP